LDPALFHSLQSSEKVTLVYEAIPALWHSRAGIIASGTATVEAGMMSTPFVMVYRVSRLTYALGRWRIKVPHFAMVNLIAGEKIVPELVQDDFTAANVVARLTEVIPDGPPRDKMLEGLARVKASLRAPDQINDARRPADRAADAILGLLGRSAIVALALYPHHLLEDNLHLREERPSVRRSVVTCIFNPGAPLGP